MRLYFELSPNTEPVPFDYQHFLIGRLHRWLGQNELHDGISLYSFSWLDKARPMKSGLNFPNGASWFVSFHDPKVAELVKQNAMQDPKVCCGCTVKTIQVSKSPELPPKYKFKLASPVLVRKRLENSTKHLIFSDEESDTVLTQTLITKLKHAKIEFQHVKVSFDRTYKNAHTKLVTINGIKNKASLCPVVVEGDAHVVQFAWNVGIGHSTGCGFGSLH
jgi:CRISPR-associated endoribonuclease Cas6